MITSTPEKNRLPLEQQSKKLKVQKQTAPRRDSTSSSESSIEISSQSDSTDVFDSDTTSDVEVLDLDDASVTQEKKVEDYVVVKVFSETKTFHHFIARIIDELGDDGDYEVKFMKASFKIKNALFTPKRMT